MGAKETAVAVGLGVTGGLVFGGLLYLLFGPRCPRCNALLLPKQIRCNNCQTSLRWER